ncbi:MAG: ribulose bisphosphate carboxylase small subunit, partial [Cyanobacteria bacterium P01_H01_bin.130]
IGTEHVDRRRFQINSWNSCKPIDATNNSQVVAELEACLADHSGEYVRVIGIDAKNKRRVYEEIVQRP